MERYMFRIYEKLVVAMQEVCDSAGARFLIYESTPGIGEKKTSKVETLCSDIDIAYLNSFDRFFRISRGRAVLSYNFDGHWNPRGHRVAGEDICGYLIRTGWIDN
jgi:hypothetical protein